MSILFIQTGGTIDKDYPKTENGWAFEITNPAFDRILEKLNPNFDYESISVCKKDSLEINEKDRAELASTIQNSTQNQIIITHGSDTLLETAHYLDGLALKKTIVLTGAMRPERFSNSDAAINLGGCISAVQFCEPGVYVFIQGIFKKATEMQRNANSKFI